MQLITNLLWQCLLSLCIISPVAGASWAFDDATISIHTKKAGVGAGLKEKYSTTTLAPLSGES